MAKKEDIEFFMNPDNPWGAISWHLPHSHDKMIYPAGFEAVEAYSPREVLRQADGRWPIDSKTTAFTKLLAVPKLDEKGNEIKDAEGNPVYIGKLKVNRSAWSQGAIKFFDNLELEYDPVAGPSLVAFDIPVVEGELNVKEYRVHLTFQRTGLRDVMIWEDLTKPNKPQYVTTYIWCFTTQKPLALAGTSEIGDTDFDQP